MASSRKPRPNSVRERALETLRNAVRPDARVCVGLSGGLDSVVLLDVVVRDARALGVKVSAVHVHHGISGRADDWVRFCGVLCDRLRVPLRVERVDIAPWRDAHGIEAAARIARYRALARLDTDAVLLAQHLDDQAETVLLQLLRGSGAAGLAAMGVERTDWAALLAPQATSDGSIPKAGAFLRTATFPKIVRPLLGVSRAEIASYAADRGLRWIDDDTNDDERFARNRLRKRLMPVLVELQPAAVANLARSARHLAAADRLLTELARADLVALQTDRGLSVSRLLALGQERGQNVLRGWVRSACAPPLHTDQLDELWRQLDARTARRALQFGWSGWSIERYRDEINVRRPSTVLDSGLEGGLFWTGQRDWCLDPLGGTLLFRRTRGRGIAAEFVRAGVVQVRIRQGGERIRLDLRSGHRTLKNLFQEHAIPPRARRAWPLVFINGVLACVPGVGYADSFQCPRGSAGWEIVWRPAEALRAGIRENAVGESKKRAKIKS